MIAFSSLVSIYDAHKNKMNLAASDMTMCDTMPCHLDNDERSSRRLVRSSSEEFGIASGFLPQSNNQTFTPEEPHFLPAPRPLPSSSLFSLSPPSLRLQT